MRAANDDVLVEQFIASFKTAPEALVLDFDATENSLEWLRALALVGTLRITMGQLRSP